MAQEDKKNTTLNWVLGLGCGIPLLIFLASETRPSANPAAPLTQAQVTGAREVMDDLIKRGAVDRFEMGASQTVRIWAGPRWKGLKMDQKVVFCNATLRYYGDRDAKIIRVVDRDEKTVGTYSPDLGYQAE